MPKWPSAASLPSFNWPRITVRFISRSTTSLRLIHASLSSCQGALQHGTHQVLTPEQIQSGNSHGGNQQTQSDTSIPSTLLVQGSRPGVPGRWRNIQSSLQHGYPPGTYQITGARWWNRLDLARIQQFQLRKLRPSRLLQHKQSPSPAKQSGVESGRLDFDQSAIRRPEYHPCFD